MTVVQRIDSEQKLKLYVNKTNKYVYATMQMSIDQMNENGFKVKK